MAQEPHWRNDVNRHRDWREGVRRHRQECEEYRGEETDHSRKVPLHAPPKYLRASLSKLYDTPCALFVESMCWNEAEHMLLSSAFHTGHMVFSVSLPGQRMQGSSARGHAAQPGVRCPAALTTESTFVPGAR